MADRDTTPAIPKNPEITVVNKLIGMCNPKLAPNTFKKKRTKAPINNFTAPWEIIRKGFTGTPLSNIKTIIVTITPTII
jgi:hypothetical protein